MLSLSVAFYIHMFLIFFLNTSILFKALNIHNQMGSSMSYINIEFTFTYIIGLFQYLCLQKHKER